MKTYRKGWLKKHKECGGLVQYIESLDPTHSEWDLLCSGCQKYICLNEITIENKNKQKDSALDKTGFYAKYILPRRKPETHLGSNGMAECGIIQASMHRPIILSEDPKQVTCYRCKKTLRYVHENSITKSNRLRFKKRSINANMGA